MNLSLLRKYKVNCWSLLFIAIAVFGILGETVVSFTDVRTGKVFSFSLSDQEDVLQEDVDEDNEFLVCDKVELMMGLTIIPIFKESSESFSGFKNSIQGRLLCIKYRCLKWYLLH
jgi:hypothetical protein